MERNELIEQYRMLHEQDSGYGVGDKRKRFTKNIIDFCNKHEIITVLDFGCGKGNVVKELNKNNITAYGYDPAIDEYKFTPISNAIYDLVISLDVFEHLLERTLDEELLKIDMLCAKYLYFNIAVEQTTDKLPNGKLCHTLVRDKEWWKNRLLGFFFNFELYKSWEDNTGCKSIVLILKRKQYE